MLYGKLRNRTGQGLDRQGQGPSLQRPGQGQGLDLQGQGQGLKLVLKESLRTRINITACSYTTTVLNERIFQGVKTYSDPSYIFSGG